VGVGAATWNWLSEHEWILEQARSDVVVGAVDWYWPDEQVLYN